MKIGIEINGVLRDTIGKIKTTYEKFLIEPENDNLESSFNYSISEPIDSLELQNHFSFQSDEEYYEFLYEEFPMEIFGHSMSSEMNTFNDFNNFYIDNRDAHQIHIISDEIGKSKPATLFFLAKFGCLCENYIFYNEKNKNETLSSFDLIVTSNPNIIIDYSNKINIIKFNTQYNQKIKCDYEINKILELHEKLITLENDKIIR
jgi:hypothetical protein